MKLVDEPHKLLQYWLEEDREILWSKATAVTFPELGAFRKSAAERVNPAPQEILRRQLALAAPGPDKENVELALNGLGKIEPLTCFEMLMLNQQLKRLPMTTNPTEFATFVLRKNNTLKVYYYTIDQPGIGNLSRVNALITKDIESGYTLEGSLHNHNFFFDKEDVKGGIVPSANDVQAFRNLAEDFGLREATITNGFNTIHISKQEFELFKAPEAGGEQ